MKDDLQIKFLLRRAGVCRGVASCHARIGLSQPSTPEAITAIGDAEHLTTTPMFRQQIKSAVGPLCSGPDTPRLRHFNPSRTPGSKTGSTPAPRMSPPARRGHDAALALGRDVPQFVTRSKRSSCRLARLHGRELKRRVLLVNDVAPNQRF